MEDRRGKGLIQQNVLQLLRLLDSQREETERGRLRGLVHKIQMVQVVGDLRSVVLSVYLRTRQTHPSCLQISVSVLRFHHFCKENSSILNIFINISGMLFCDFFLKGHEVWQGLKLGWDTFFQLLVILICFINTFLVCDHSFSLLETKTKIRGLQPK